MPQSVQAAAPDLETWTNATQGRIVVKMHNSQGVVDDILVAPRKNIHVTPNDRRMNQELAADPTQDPFQNGFLAPVRLIDGEADSELLMDNPNVITEDEMTAMFSKDFESFTARVEEITLPITLQRLLRISSDVETAQVRQVNAIKARISKLSPQTHDEVVSMAGDGPVSVGRATSPR